MLPKHHLVLFALVGFWARMTTQAAVPSTTEALLSTTEAPLSTTEVPSTMSEDSATNTATGTGVRTHIINVGSEGYKFSPNDIKADVGDILEYWFYPDGHWVIRGDFDHPCIPYEDIDPSHRTGFSSGAQPVKVIGNDAPRFRVRVNDTNPIFYYCGASGSCVKYHMMGVVNPSKNETLNDWLEKAKGVDIQLTPGQPFPTENYKTSTTYAAPDSTTSAIPDPTGGSSYNPGDENGHNHGLSAGAVAGIAIGGAAVLILAVGVIYLCGRRGVFDKAYRKTFDGSAVLAYPKGAPPVVEAEVGSPNAAAPGIWVYKTLAPMASSSGQSPRTNSPLTPVYNFPQGVETMMPQGSSSLNTHCVPNSKHLTTPPPPRPPKEELIASAELPVQRLAEPAAELPASANTGS